MLALKVPLPFIQTLSSDEKAPSSILVLGGSSSVGAAAIQLLRQSDPALPIIATSSIKHHQRLMDLGANHAVDYKGSDVLKNITAASPDGVGVDVILDCVGAGSSQTDICDALNPTGLKNYAAVFTGLPIPVPEGVRKIDTSAEHIFQAEGGNHVIAEITRLVEEGIYKVPLPVVVSGHGLEAIDKAIDRVTTASGEKIVVTL
jgi:NADPH:quinone reductase-like Zn-dependent oxidoreductase